MTFTQFVNESNKCGMTAAQDKNPMFYILSGAKLRAGATDELRSDEKLKAAFKAVEKLNKGLGDKVVNEIAACLKPINVLMDYSTDSNIKNKETLKAKAISMYEMCKQTALNNVESFSDAYDREKLFKNLYEDEAFKDFFESIEFHKQ